MIVDVILIAIVGAIAGLVSIPFGFMLTSSVWVVFLGNAIGSLVGAIALLYFSDKLIARFFKKGLPPERVARLNSFINNHGLWLFGLISPLFPGVAVSVPAAMLLKLDMRRFKRWLFTGIFVVSGCYVVGYWWVFVK